VDTLGKRIDYLEEILIDHSKLYNKLSRALQYIEENFDHSRSKSLFFTKIDEAMLWLSIMIQAKDRKEVGK